MGASGVPAARQAWQTPARPGELGIGRSGVWFTFGEKPPETPACHPSARSARLLCDGDTGTATGHLEGSWHGQDRMHCAYTTLCLNGHKAATLDSGGIDPGGRGRDTQPLVGSLEPTFL